MAVQRLEPRHGLRPERDHLGEVGAVLAPEVAEQLATHAQRVEPLRIVDHAVVRGQQLVGDVGGVGLQAAQTRLERRERRSAAERGDGGAERVDHLAVDRAVRITQRLPDADRVGEALLLVVEPRVLARRR